MKIKINVKLFPILYTIIIIKGYSEWIYIHIDNNISKQHTYKSTALHLTDLKLPFFVRSLSLSWIYDRIEWVYT